MTQATPTRAQAASHLRAGHAAVRNLRVARAVKARADLVAFMDEPLSVSPVTVKVREPNDRLLGLLLADREWTAEEREYVELCERNGR